MRTIILMLAVSITLVSLASGAMAAELPAVESVRSRHSLRNTPNGTGPTLASLKADSLQTHSQVLAPASAAVFVDLPCNSFLPGKADPSEFMSTVTFVKATNDGINYQYGYDPFSQVYDVAASGLAVPPGVLAQETVGIVASRLPEIINSTNVDRVELWFVVQEHNLFPFERLGITALEENLQPSSSLNSITAQLLYEDARGIGGAVYFLGHLAIGAHAIDLGSAAVTDLSAQVASGWFGVGFAADGWDLSGSLNEVVFWIMTGGGSLQTDLQPFFRIYYNAPPNAFALETPQANAATSLAQPTFSWSPAIDPNGDTPISYTLRLASNPEMNSAFELDAGAALSIMPPFPLAPATYYWQVIARDPRGELRASEQRQLQILAATDSQNLPMAFQHGAYPNPFNPRTTIHFSLREAARIDLAVYDAQGRRLRTLVNGLTRSAGHHQFQWDGTDASGRSVSTGTYFYRLNAGTHQVTSKLNLVK